MRLCAFVCAFVSGGHSYESLVTKEKKETVTFNIKAGLAQMLKGGVIMGRERHTVAQRSPLPRSSKLLACGGTGCAMWLLLFVVPCC